MKQVQKTSSAELKREAGQLAQTRGKPVAQVARELGISETSLHQWRKDLAAHADEAFPGSGHQTAKVRGNPPPQTRPRAVHSTFARDIPKRVPSAVTLE